MSAAHAPGAVAWRRRKGPDEDWLDCPQDSVAFYEGRGQDVQALVPYDPTVIAWQATPPPQDGSTVYGMTWSPYRWHPYGPQSKERRAGRTGRWQTLSDYGTWFNAPPPSRWASLEAVTSARAAGIEAAIDREPS